MFHFDSQLTNMGPLPAITVDTISGLATLKNLAYLSGCYVLFKSAQLTYQTTRRILSPLRHLAGPQNDSVIFGNTKRIFGAPLGVVHEEWLEKYGSTFTYKEVMLVRNSVLPYNLFSN
jgi:hypothetical protein